MILKAYYEDLEEEKWLIIALEYTYGGSRTYLDIPEDKRFTCAPNDKDGVKDKLKNWADKDDKFLLLHLQEAVITFIDAA